MHFKLSYRALITVNVLKQPMLDAVKPNMLANCNVNIEEYEKITVTIGISNKQNIK